MNSDDRRGDTEDSSVPASRDAGAVLRGRREELGLTLEQVASATRIPFEHLVALEDGRPSDLPAGPYGDAYLRALEDYLDLPLDAPVLPPGDDGSVPLWAVRWLAVASVLAVFGTVAWQTWKPTADGGPIREEVASAAPALEVQISPRKSVHVKVLVDDAVALDAQIPGGRAITFAGKRRVAVEVPAVDAVRIEYDGQPIVPQGRQDAPRRLVFIDDVGSER